MGAIPGIGGMIAGVAAGYVAPTYIGGSNYTYSVVFEDVVSVDGNTPNGTRLVGDVMLAIRQSTSSGDTGGPSTGTWAYYGEIVYDGSNRVKLWSKALATNGESASWTGVPGTFVTLRGVDLLAPIADFAAEYLATNNTTVNFPGATAAREKSLVVAVTVHTAAVAVNAYTNADLSSLTERQDNTQNIQSVVMAMRFATGIKDVAGAIADTGTATLASSASAKAGVLIVLNPA